MYFSGRCLDREAVLGKDVRPELRDALSLSPRVGYGRVVEGLGLFLAVLISSSCRACTLSLEVRFVLGCRLGRTTRGLNIYTIY